MSYSARHPSPPATGKESQPGRASFKDLRHRRRQRLQRLEEGAEELQRWLEDVVHTGSATTVNQSAAFWEGQAARIVDAQAPGLARMVGEMQIPASRPAFQDLMLEQIARIYLVLEGFKRPPGNIQHDVRALEGRPRNRRCWWSSR